MRIVRSRWAAVLPFALVAAAAIGALGCGAGDGITVTTVPKSEKGDKDAPPAAGGYRILGALVPAGQPGWFWFFKFTGTADQIAAHEAEFDKLAKSVKLQADPTALPAFELPAGWTRTGPRVMGAGGPVQVRFDEVLKVGPDAGLECTVSYAGGGAKGNLDRWAGQVGATDAGKATTEFDANGVTATRVDLRGPKKPSMGGPMMGGK